MARAWCCWILFFLPLSGLRATVPWADADTEIYEVHWGLVVAAEAKLTVGKVPRGWETVLELRSRGMVETLYPIRSRFVSQFDPGAERSFGLEEVRHEGGKDKHHRLVLDPELRQGRYEPNVAEGNPRIFDLPHGECQDVLSMLYATRTVAWGPGVAREWDVCENKRVKRVRMSYVKDETIEDAAGKDRICRVLGVEELPDREGRVPKKPLQVKVWVDKSSSQPLRADLRAVFGTFRLTRVLPET